jgi:hypothetical protein
MHASPSRAHTPHVVQRQRLERHAKLLDVRGRIQHGGDNGSLGHRAEQPAPFDVSFSRCRARRAAKAGYGARRSVMERPRARSIQASRRLHACSLSTSCAQPTCFLHLRLRLWPFTQGETRRQWLGLCRGRGRRTRSRSPGPRTSGRRFPAWSTASRGWWRRRCLHRRAAVRWAMVAHVWRPHAPDEAACRPPAREWLDAWAYA